MWPLSLYRSAYLQDVTRTTHIATSAGGSRPLDSDVASGLRGRGVGSDLSALAAEEVGIAGAFHRVDRGYHTNGAGPLSA